MVTVSHSTAEPQSLPLISVVIPCYAQARFLGQAIESVLAQRHPHREIIVVDDGSPDQAGTVAARYPCVRYLRQPNQGVSAARNAGLAASSGTYVAFLDADDRLLPDALSAGAACFAEHPECAFVYGNFRFIAEDGTPLGRRTRGPEIGGLYRTLLGWNHIEMTSTVLFRRDVLREMGGFITWLRCAEDYELLLRIARQYPTVAHEALVAEYRRYNRYESSLSHDPARMLRSTLTVLRAQRPYIRGSADDEAALESGLRFFQDYYGGELVIQTRDLLRDRAWHRALWRIVLLLRHYPRGIVERLARKTREALHPASG